MASEIRVNQIQNRSGLSTVTFTDTGLVISGITTISGSLNAPGGTTISAGSTSAPSISPVGDSNTGIFFPSADTVCIGEGGVEALRVDSSANIGINSTSPARKLDVVDSGASGSVIRSRVTTDNGGYLAYEALNSSGTSVFSVTHNGRINLSENIVFASGQGLDFSATANSSGTMTSELLNDYEEGTWTPIASASAGTITSYTSSGRYTKVGRTVTLHFIITITNQGTASGTYLYWSGAPYVAANTFTMVGTCREQSVNGFLSTAQINGNASSGTVLRYDNSGVIVNGGNFSCTIVYEAA